MKEIGGYYEIEENHGLEYYRDNAVRLNSARNCLAYLIEARKIKKIYLPYFLCGDVKKLCQKYGVSIEYYNINSNFTPCIIDQPHSDAYIYIVNYYGQLTDNMILNYKQKFRNIILDNVQAFFHVPIDGVDTIYSCRKFFGVSDGAYLITDSVLERELSTDVSYDRMRFLLGRYETTASTFFAEAVQNNELFTNEPIKKMSRLTQNLLSGLNYEFIIKRREENFNFLHSKLESINQINVKKSVAPFSYPLLVADGEKTKKYLIQQKIYIPTLWREVLNVCPNNSVENNFTKNILPIPCDQRYTTTDMNRIYMVLIELIDNLADKD